MEENIKITHTKNMNKFNFNSTISIPIDSNANIKSILDINTYLFDQKVECGNGKAIISGKIGVKILYLDTDNITNTISDNQSFSETYSDNSITSETYLNIFNSTIVNNILSTDGNLKINCDISITPVAYLNLSLKNNFETNEMLITKKSEILTNTITKYVNTKFEHALNLETKDKISKILYHNSYFTPEKTTSEDGYMIVEGKIISCLLYETIKDDDVIVKELREASTLKCDVEINELTKNNDLDISFTLDKSQEEITTELEDENSVITIKNMICASGIVLKNVSIDVIDDMYSSEYSIETTAAKREYTKKAEHFSVSENISNEITLESSEPAIDEVIANLGISPEITNLYIKNNSIYLEGIVTSNLTYIDENKELKHKQIEIPFIIDTKIQAEALGSVHHNISVLDNKVKIKRGTIIEVEYCLFVNLEIYEKETHETIDSYSLGKQLDFSKYDFQIFVAKQGETLWELCKRIKISPDNINKYNKDLPLIMEGGEKVIIKR